MSRSRPRAEHESTRRAELPAAWPGLPVAELFDAAAFSCEIGARKPDPIVFKTIAGRLGVVPEDCLYVGDGGGHELTGSSAVGMTAVMLRAPDWHLNDAHAREDDWPGESVASFTELLTRTDLSMH